MSVLERDHFQLPLSGSQGICLAEAESRLQNHFQLPLSGSLHGLAHFNHVDRLSTPSLGITEVGVERAQKQLLLFQLPLSGSLTLHIHEQKEGSPSIFQLPLSGSRITIKLLASTWHCDFFQLPLSGSRES
jgi:hypothetical protein